MDKLSANTINALSYSIIGIILILACWTDFDRRRIPNKLILTGIIMGIILQALIPKGMGLFDSAAGSIGVVSALCGFMVGLGIMMPLYALRTMGAGDVKLMGMIGIFLGPTAVLGATFMTFIVGGIIAIAVAIWTKVFYQTLENVKAALTHTLLTTLTRQRAEAPSLVNSTTKLPYAIAIALGTFFQIIFIRVNCNIFF